MKVVAYNRTGKCIPLIETSLYQCSFKTLTIMITVLNKRNSLLTGQCMCIYLYLHGFIDTE